MRTRRWVTQVLAFLAAGFIVPGLVVAQSPRLPLLTITRKPILRPNPAPPGGVVTGVFDWNLRSNEAYPQSAWVSVYGWLDSQNNWVGPEPVVFYKGVPGAYPGHTETSKPISLAVPPTPGTYTLWANAYDTEAEDWARQQFKQGFGDYSNETEWHRTMDMVTVGGPVNVNLSVTSSDFGPQAPVQMHPGDPLTINAFVENLGQGPAGPCWIEVWGSRTGGLTLDRFLATSLRLPGEIAGGGAYPWIATVPIYSIPDGPYTVVYTVNRLGEIAESSLLDDRTAVRSKRLLVIRPQTQVDLAVEGFALTPNPAHGGGPIAFSGRVINRGRERSGPFWIEFWGSWEWPYPALNFFLCDSIFTESLDPGGSVNLANYPRQLYNVPTGAFTAGCVADRDDSINELDETNNYQFNEGQVFNQVSQPKRQASKAQGAADIRITAADFSPASPTQLAPGDPALFSADVTNAGTGNTGPFWVEYWGSRDGGLTLSDFLAVSDRVTNLPPGMTVHLSSVKSLYGISDGPYSVVVVADRPNDVGEADETNNRRIVSGKRLLVIRPPTGANLVVELLRVDSPQSWPNLVYVGLVSNTGTTDSGPFWVEFWVCPGNPVFPWLGDFLSNSIHVDNLGPGEVISFTEYELTAYNSIPGGEYTLIAIADRLDQVVETDETDNYKIVRHVTIPTH